MQIITLTNKLRYWELEWDRYIIDDIMKESLTKASLEDIYTIIDNNKNWVQNILDWTSLDWKFTNPFRLWKHIQEKNIIEL